LKADGPKNARLGGRGLPRTEPYEQWPTAMVLVERGGPPVRTTIIGRKEDAIRTLFEWYHSNAMLGTARYEGGTAAAVTSKALAKDLSFTRQATKMVLFYRLPTRLCPRENGVTTSEFGES
jgi:hypothetical protein